jgi:hypothetical protein
MKSFFIALSVGGGRPRNSNDPPPRAPRYRRCSSECEVPPLGNGIQAIQLSPYRAGLAGRHLQRLPVAPAFLTCCCPLRLSPSGKPDDPGTFLRVHPDCVRNSTPRSAAHSFPSYSSSIHKRPVRDAAVLACRSRTWICRWQLACSNSRLSVVSQPPWLRQIRWWM